MFLLGWFRIVENFLFVPRCVFCRKDGELLCRHHLKSLRRVNKPFELEGLQVWAPFAYQKPLVRRVLERFKYKGIRGLGSSMAAEMVMPKSHENGIVVPIPLHWTRKLWRGFNQADLLAKELSDLHNLSFSKDLKRIKRSAQQARLKKVDRAKNVENIFEWKGFSLAGKTVYLVDDVCTTGATLKSAAQVLQKQGVKEVVGVVFARG